MLKRQITACCVAIVMCIGSAQAEDLYSTKNLSVDLATELARAAMLDCRDKGYQVSVAVVDRNGILRVAMRDDLASRFTMQISEEKANLAVMAGTSTADFRSRRGDIRPEMNHLDGIIVMEGGLEITAGGARLGAIAVSGAPGGDIDEACAQAALDKYEERLEFAE